MSAALPVGGDKFVTNGAAVNAMWELHASDGSIVWQHAFDQRFTGVGDCPSATDGIRVFCDYLAPTAEGLDKFSASLHEAVVKSPLAGPALGSMVDWTKHRDSLVRTSATYK